MKTQNTWLYLFYYPNWYTGRFIIYAKDPKKLPSMAIPLGVTVVIRIKVNKAKMDEILQIQGLNYDMNMLVDEID